MVFNLVALFLILMESKEIFGVAKLLYILNA